jgi:hypothetical protein
MMQKRTISGNGIVLGGGHVQDGVDKHGGIMFRYNGVS